MAGDGGITRKTFVRGGALGAGALAAGGALAGGLPDLAASAPSASQDEATFAYLLELEDLQAAFYAEAVKRGALTGETKEYARIVGQHEQEHVAYVRKVLGAQAKPAKDFDFGDTTTSDERFLATAVEIEETGLGAYTGAAINLTRGKLAAATRIVSVEARHTAWARDLADKNPAPVASDKPATEREVRATVAKTSFVKDG